MSSTRKPPTHNVEMKNVRITQAGVGILAGDNFNLKGSNVHIEAETAAIILGENGTIDVDNLRLIVGTIPNELREGLKASIGEGKSDQEIIRTFGDRLKPYIDVADLAAKGINIITAISKFL